MVTFMTVGLTCFRSFTLFGGTYNVFDFALLTPKLLIILGVLILIALGLFLAFTMPMKSLFEKLNKRFEGKSFRPKNT